ncbi:MAG TPA: NUDIX domain-containing protein [Candidatus Nanoarchaeia archaeon]|nr:NUDIX domain-containing protein [Candidatus Nanoarchaeia archaeon]
MTEEIKKPGVGFGVMILKDNKLLLGKRHPDPEKASSLLHGEGTWTMPGGKLHFGESFEQGAIREVNEETGLDVISSKVISISNDIVSDAHFVTIGLLCSKFKGQPRVMEPDEITEWQWFPINQLPEPIFPPSEKVLKNYLEKRFYNY